MIEKKSLKNIWLMFVLFIIIFIVNLNVSFDIPATARMWIVIEIWSIILSIILLIRNKFPSKKKIAVSFGLSILAVSCFFYSNNIFAILKGFIETFLATLAVFSTFEKHKENSLYILKTETKGILIFSIVLGILIGVIWGAINYFLMISSNNPHFEPSFASFLTALNPAIFEEIALRTLFFAFCLNSLNGKITTRRESFTCWFMMIVPHVLIHTPDSFIYGGTESGLISTLLYIIVFGLPFTMLQKKRDVTSAMIAHGSVDFIRFCFFGLPF